MKIPKILNRVVTIAAGAKEVSIGAIPELDGKKVLAILTKSSEVPNVLLSLKTSGQVSMIENTPARLFDPEVTNAILEIETPEAIAWEVSKAMVPANLGAALSFNLTIIYK